MAHSLLTDNANPATTPAESALMARPLHAPPAPPDSSSLEPATASHHAQMDTSHRMANAKPARLDANNAQMLPNARPVSKANLCKILPARISATRDTSKSMELAPSAKLDVTFATTTRPATPVVMDSS
jgi:hypothetical protein